MTSATCYNLGTLVDSSSIILPNWLSLLAPHVYTSPVVDKATVCRWPQDTCLTTFVSKELTLSRKGEAGVTAHTYTSKKKETQCFACHQTIYTWLQHLQATPTNTSFHETVPTVGAGLINSIRPTTSSVHNTCSAYRHQCKLTDLMVTQAGVTHDQLAGMMVITHGISLAQCGDWPLGLDTQNKEDLVLVSVALDSGFTFVSFSGRPVNSSLDKCTGWWLWWWWWNSGILADATNPPFKPHTRAQC